MKRILPALIFLFAITTTCYPAKKGNKKLYKSNLVSLYNENTFTTFDAVVYHSSDTLSTVFVNVHLADLTYIRHLSANENIADFKIHYELFQGWDAKIPLDTGSFIYSDRVNYGIETDMIVDFDVRAVFPGDYLVKIELTDMNRSKENTVFKFYDISKSDRHSTQNYYAMDENGLPLFNKSVKKGQYFIIKRNSKDLSNSTESTNSTSLTNSTDLYIRYYNRQLPIAKPPFSTDKAITFKFEPDSIFTVSMTHGESPLLELPYNGIYHFQTDISQVEGFTLFHFDDGFPEITNPVEAVLPLRYLTTQKEYDVLLNYHDYKIAVDSFWLQRSSQQEERAKNMIARYYSRVQDANKLFTSYQEGWKTDRGILYIIYGPPTEVYRKDGEEEWVYGERGNPLSIKFYFYSVDNAFTDNDYRLQRSSIYKTSWYIAIENWRR